MRQIFGRQFYFPRHSYLHIIIFSEAARYDSLPDYQRLSGFFKSLCSYVEVSISFWRHGVSLSFFAAESKQTWVQFTFSNHSKSDSKLIANRSKPSSNCITNYPEDHPQIPFRINLETEAPCATRSGPRTATAPGNVPEKGPEIDPTSPENIPWIHSKIPSKKGTKSVRKKNSGNSWQAESAQSAGRKQFK